ncbi:MAG: nucleotidyltransferase domain-containing protein [Anaerolineales bacterium]|nr:nucleotidyltransferase domain-containing protein [Anaerolineales bacterium]
MRNIEHIQDFITPVITWAAMQPDIQAIALVGSYARGAATDTSDIDFILLVDDPHRYITNIDWVKQFGTIGKQQIEEYGMVTSLRVWYLDGTEVEFGITTTKWTQLPLDEGTQNIIQDGMQVLYERRELLSPLLRLVF